MTVGRGGDFLTIQGAVDALPSDLHRPVEIRILPGVYREKLRVDKPFVHLRGEDAATTVLTWDDHATKTHPDGRKYGTFESFTLFVGADNFRAQGLTIENAAGPGSLVGQAVAAYVDADRVVFHRCRFVGHQDTLFTGPLPPAPLVGTAFGGPRSSGPRRPGRHYYHDCFLQGDVDFLFGSATAVFDRCEIFSRRRDEVVNGWITAASTPEGQTHGYVFVDCRLTGDAAPGSVYLGRPWRDHARVVLVRCWLGPHIHPQGWDDWDKPRAQSTSFFAEMLCDGPGADPATRVEWERELPESALGLLTPERLLAGVDGWNPTLP